MGGWGIFVVVEDVVQNEVGFIDNPQDLGKGMGRTEKGVKFVCFDTIFQISCQSCTDHLTPANQCNMHLNVKGQIN